MSRRKFANWIRFFLGLTVALLVGIDSYNAGRGPGLTYGLPAVIGLLAITDFVGYLCE